MRGLSVTPPGVDGVQLVTDLGKSFRIVEPERASPGSRNDMVSCSQDIEDSMKWRAQFIRHQARRPKSSDGGLHVLSLLLISGSPRAFSTGRELFANVRECTVMCGVQPGRVRGDAWPFACETKGANLHILYGNVPR